ncbi:AAA domain [Vibrio sp. B1ASS3]|uniref:DEAD/DEAH box helicase family protein n=1 Tax=Vibrio sp. B1ASS3 TaxID=2751176 RepID=UPI001ABAA0D7|nr:DEAD/DEAH box helicase family protein [Vibrio sp. B1ASS3]CAD7811830.1 AAA domain [Vibrio sp. B1ASS3]CAE6916013.1 AAA domain [Vibrio sp. B1ASS3]
MELRSHQNEAVNNIVDSYLRKEKRALVSMPIGTGKSAVILSAIEMIFDTNPAKQFIILVNTRDLKHQFEHLIEIHWSNLGSQIHVETCQYFLRESSKINCDNLVVFADSIHFNYFIKIHGFFESLNDESSFFCYFTHTPSQLYRASQFAPIVYRYTFEQAIGDKNLVPIRVHREFIPDDENRLKFAVGKVLSEVSNKSNRKVVFSCQNIEDAILAHKELKEIASEDSIVLLTSKTRDVQLLLNDFNSNKNIKYCVGVNLVLEIVNNPDVTDIVLLRRLSDSRLVQAISRVNRLNENKDSGFVWDFARNDIDKVLSNYGFIESKYIDRDDVSWVDAYKEVRKLLSEFYNQEEDESSSILFELCYNDKIFRDANSWIAKTTGPKVLDPLRVYSSISDSRIEKELRITRINSYCKLLSQFLGGLHEPVFYPNINFSGSPSLNHELLIVERSKQEVSYLWEIFHDAIYFPERGINRSSLVAFKNWGASDLRNLSIFLFLVQPDYFLPLDKQTLSLLKQYGKIKKEPSLVREYNQLLTGGNTTAYRTIYFLSRNKNNPSDLSALEKSDYDSYIGGLSLNLLSEHKCRILAVTPKKNCNTRFLRSLTEDKCYKFYQDFDLKGDEIHYISDREHGLFDLSDLKLCISSIVGKNGTGKSTIIELLMAAFNNVTSKTNDYSKVVGLHKLDWIEDINLDFWFETDSIYRVSMEGESIEILKYKHDGDDIYVFDVAINTSEFDYGSFFYTLNVNYSLHALNSRHQGEWIERLFHKNDGYQTPIVLEPYRVEGNIDVNVQEALAKQRLLSNILMVESSDSVDEYSLRNLKDGVNASYLSLHINTEKNSNNSQDEQSILLHDIESEKLLSLVFDRFSVNIADNDDFYLRNIKVFDTACKYIINKLYQISSKYATYNEYFDQKRNKFVYANRFISRLYNDHSHITYKIRQAINYIKYDIYRGSCRGEIALDETSQKIHNITKHDSDEKLEYLLPPSFFKVGIYLENKVEFSELSSGEKQKIYVISSILYHLRNLDSVSASGNKDLIKFNYVNIFLDEVELCFHPELQRTFIYDLRKAINKLNLNYIYGVNFCFVTHSPFLLSDIPSGNIMFLDNNKDKSTSPNKLSSIHQNTFAANVHDLLIDGFFMDSSIGKFAEETIREIVKFHSKVIRNDDINSLKEEYLSLSERFEYTHEIISDSYIKGVVYNHLSEIKDKLNLLQDKDSIELEIAQLERKLENLKGIYNASN